MTSTERWERAVIEALARISRGPCGGWHYNDTRDRRWFCHTCVALGNLRSAG